MSGVGLFVAVCVLARRTAVLFRRFFGLSASSDGPFLDADSLGGAAQAGPGSLSGPETVLVSGLNTFHESSEASDSARWGGSAPRGSVAAVRAAALLALCLVAGSLAPTFLPASANAANATVNIVGTESRGWVDEGTDVEFTLTRDAENSNNSLTVAVQVVTFSFKSAFGFVGASTNRDVQDLVAVFHADSATTTLTVPSVDNKLNDGNRQVQATIMSGTDPVSVNSRQASVWVRDDDLPTLTLTPVTEDHIESEDSLPQYILSRSWDSDDAAEYAEADVAQYDLIARVARYGIRWFPDCPYVVGSVLYEGAVLQGRTCEFSMEDIADGTEASLLRVGMPPTGDVHSYSSSSLFVPVKMPSGDSSHIYDMPPRHVVALGGFAYVALQPFKCDVVPGNCGYLPQYEIGSPADAKVNLHNDAPGVRIESDDEQVFEGEDITFTVSRYGGVPLNSRTALSVSVAVTQNGEFISGSTPQTVSFAAADPGEDPDLTQTVTISTVDDSIDEPDGTVTLTVLEPPAALEGEDVANYEPVGADGADEGWYSTITVIVADNDVPEVDADFENAAYEVAEGGTVEVTVTLSNDPKRKVVVPITATGQGGASSAEYAGVPESLTFSTGETSKKFTFASIDDDFFEDGESVLLGFGSSLPSRVNAGTVAQSTVSITDDDTVGVDISETALTVAEGDPDGASYSVELTSEPAGDVTVTVSGHSGTDVGLSGSTLTSNVLTFTTVNWGVAQTVTVTAAEDDDAVTDPAVTLVHAVASTDDSDYDALTDQTVTVTITDDDAVGVSINPTALTVAEGDPDGASYSVELTSEPAGDVTVTVSGHSGTDVGLSGSTLTSNVLTFTTVNWGVAQTVTVTAAEDDDAVTDPAVTLVHAVASTDDSDYDALTDQTVTVTITDDDAVGVSINPTALTVAEGSSKSYSVELTSQPAGDVTVTVSGHSGTDVGLSAALFTDNKLTFTTVNWATAQTVTVTAAEDDDAVTDPAVTLVHAVASTDDSDYDALTDQTVTVTITDDDAVGVSINPTALTVAEGSSKSYSVELTSQPAGDVTVTVSGHSGTDVGLSAALFTDNKLTFTTANWATAQTVTVTAAEDDDAVTDPAVTLVHAVASTDDSDYDALTDQTVTVTITDDDAVGVSINPTALTVAEGSSKSYSVELTSQPAGDVTVTVSGHSGTDVGLSAALFTDNKLTFTTVNWATAQTVTVTAAEDDDAVTDPAVTLVHAVASTDDSDYDALTDQTVTVTITDDDAVGVDISETTLTVTEGSSKSYSVELTSQPAGDVTVTVSGHSGTDVGLSGSTLTSNVLTFTTVNWGVAQTVTVTAAEDDDAVTDPAVTLVHAVASTDDSDYDALTDQTVTVTITDNDAVGVDISETTLTVTEGSSKSYSVELTSQPAGDVTVTVSGHSGTDVGLSGSTLTSNVLTFTTVNWGVAQTVTVTAAEDDDAVTDAAVALVHAVASTDDAVYNALADQTVTITVTDDDAVGVSINPTELTVVEGSSMDYTVELTSQPAGDVTVTVSGHAGSGAALSGTSLSADDVLTFTTVNWSTAQTVAVTGTDDSTAEADETVTLAHAISSTDDSAYDTLEDVSVTVTVQDNDSVGVSINPTTLTVVEGSSKSYSVELTSQPAGDVTVTVSGHSGTDVGLSAALFTDNKLTFTTVNWATAQTVTVTAAEDDDAVTDPAVTLAHAIASADDSDYDALTDQTVTVTITDDDAVGVDISQTALTVTEGDADGVSYTVELTSEPAGDVTVTVSGHSGTDVGLSGLTLTSNVLTFTTANWATAQTVTVTAAEDDDADTDAAVTLVHAVASADDSDYDALTDQTVTITITDNDTVGVDISETALTVAEGDANGVSYSVKLTSEPAGDVTVTVSGHSGTDVGLSGLDGNSKLTFTTMNWGVAQTVTVTAAEDDDAVTDAAVALAHAIASADDSAYDALTDQTVTVTITDNDTRGVSINPTELTVLEGSSKSYTVKLTSQPAGDVTVTVSGHSGTDVALSGSTLTSNVLTFTTVNWNVAQTVTVTAAEDDDAVTDAAVPLAHAIASADDSDYDALEDVSVTVSITDDDAVGVDISETALTVTEGSSKSYTVELTSQPGGDVTVTVSGHSGTDVALSGSTLTSNVLTFTTVNWNVAQTVTVTAAEDDDAVTDAAVALAHAIASADDSDYDALTDQTVTVTITDDDAVGVDISETALTVTEGSSKSYTVELTSQPAGDVTVTVSGHSGTDVALSGLTLTGNVLTFTTANWATAQTVTVTAAEDDDAVTDAAVPLAHAIASADDSDYDALADQTVTVTITDNDAVGVDISETALTVAEGDANGVSYSVKLTSEPAGDVTVTVSGHSGTDVALSGLTLTGNVLTFTTVNWATAQTVTVTAAEDDDAVTDAAVALVHAIASADDSDYDALADQTVTVTITDDDAVGVDISETALTVTEGSSKSYSVELTSQPAGDVTVTVSGHSGTDVGLAGLDGNNVLTFTTVNWNTAQTVTVTAAEDDDIDDAAVILVHAISSIDDSTYNNLADQTVTVTITDNDDPAGVHNPETVMTAGEGDPVEGSETALTVTFEKDFHRTSEGASGGAFATVQLSTAPQTRVTIPIRVSSTTTAQTDDYELSTQPFQADQNYAAISGTFDVTFEAGDSAVYFAIRALPDSVFENDEKVALEFGALPAGISTGSPSATTFHLVDTQTVSFGATSYSATEGGPGATVTVNLDYAPTGGAIVCLVVENQAGTSDDDYVGVPDELVFAGTETSRSFVVTVVDDADSDGGGITVGFGCLSGEFREGSPSSTTVNLLDDDQPGGNTGAEGLPAPRGFIATFLTFDGHYYNKTQNSVTLLWFPLDRAVLYMLEHRKTADGGDWAVVAGDFEEYTGGGGPVAVAAGLVCDTEYDFRLSGAAVENADASGFGNYAETRARTGPCPEPELVTNILVAMTPACATLHWAAPLDGRAVAYRVQRTDLGQLPAVTATLTAGTAGTTFRHCPSGGYPPGSSYFFWVAALAADAEVYGQNYTQAVDAGPKGPPNVPRDLRFATQGPQVRSLAWDPPANVWLTTVREAAANDGYSDEVADPWVSYVVQRAELEPDSVPGHETLVDGIWHDLGEVTGTTFTDRENIGDRIFVYRVLTRNPNGFTAGYGPEIWMER